MQRSRFPEAPYSTQIYRVALEVFQRAIIQRALMGGAQHHTRRLARLKGFLPARRAKTPAVPRLQSGKSKFRQRRRKVIALGLGELQKRIGHHRADRVAADILGARIATAIAEEAGHRRRGTGLQSFTEHVAGWPRTPSKAFGFNRHNDPSRSRMRASAYRNVCSVWIRTGPKGRLPSAPPARRFPALARQYRPGWP